jgi:hypothetical protein
VTLGLSGACALLPLPAAASVFSLHASTVIPGKAVLALGCLVLSALALFFTRGLGTKQAGGFFLLCGAGAVLALLSLPGFLIGALWNLRGPHYRKDDPAGRQG